MQPISGYGRSPYAQVPYAGGAQAPAPPRPAPPPPQSAGAGQVAGYNFAPTAPTPTAAPPVPGATLVTPSNGTTPYYQLPGGQGQIDVGNLPQNVGMYQEGSAADIQGYKVGSKYNLTNDPNYQQYAQLGTEAQQYGRQAQQGLNNPYVSGAIGMQGQLAGGPTTGQRNASTAQVSALGLLGNAAAGNGPSAAQAQLRSGADQAVAQAQAQAASTRGNMGLANAEKGAQVSAAQTTQQSANAAAMLRAQEMQSAQQAYAGAAGQYGQVQNQAAAIQGQAAGQYGQTALAQQGAVMGYYTGQQQAAQEQQQMAANMGIAQLNANYGLSGTQLQTQTQQNIANQQQTGTDIGAVVGGAALVGAALL
jgi:hypothetical protein